MTLTGVDTGAVTGMGALGGTEGGVAVAGVTVSLFKKLKDVGRATPKIGRWEDVAGDSGPGSGREAGRARGGIVESSGGRAVARRGRDPVDEARDAEAVLDVLLVVEERGGGFPTYPHCPKIVVSL